MLDVWVSVLWFSQVLIKAWRVCDRHVTFKLDLQLDLCWWKRGIKSIICSYLCSLNHLVAGAETFLHHGAQLLSFKLQLLTDKIHLHGELWSTEKCIICTACMLFFLPWSNLRLLTVSIRGSLASLWDKPCSCE